MTIYKTQTGEKKNEKDPEVLTEPLTGVKDELDDEEAGGVPKVVRVTYSPRRRRVWVNLCLILTALLVLATGTIAAIFLYRHLSSKVIRGRCGVGYYDEYFHQADPQYQQHQQLDNAYLDHPSLIQKDTPAVDLDFFEEDIEVSEVSMYERLTVPRFDEVEETVVWHDFTKNLTAIVDPTHRVCYIMSLNRSSIAPPRNLIDLLQKLKSRYYMPKASVVREQYRVVLPPMSSGELPQLGQIIMQECYWYQTFRLEKFIRGVWKRSTDLAEQPQPGMHLEATLGYFSLQATEDQSHIFKYNIYKQDEEVVAPAAADKDDDNEVDEDEFDDDEKVATSTL